MAISASFGSQFETLLVTVFVAGREWGDWVGMGDSPRNRRSCGGRPGLQLIRRHTIKHPPVLPGLGKHQFDLGSHPHRTRAADRQAAHPCLPAAEDARRENFRRARFRHSSATPPTVASTAPAFIGHHHQHTGDTDQSPQTELQRLHFWFSARDDSVTHIGVCLQAVDADKADQMGTGPQGVDTLDPLCQGKPLPTASRMLRKPWASNCCCRPSRIRGTRSGPWKIQPV